VWGEDDGCFGVMDSGYRGGVDLKASDMEMQVIDDFQTWVLQTENSDYRYPRRGLGK
jgi:hypothetical protein